VKLFQFIIIFLLPFLASCQTAPVVQPQVNSLVIGRRFDQALKILSEQKDGYGKKNELLFLLDKGLVLHLAGRYQESIPVFAQAKAKYDELYTESLTRFAGSWVWNNYTLPYRGEDFERVMINIFQALNYVALGDWEGALVEARDADSTLNAINRQYSADQQNVYREDGFARLLMGILYESTGQAPDINDAFIDYAKAFKIYQSDYVTNYGLHPPKILQENLLATAAWMGGQEAVAYSRLLAGVQYSNLPQKNSQAEIYVIHYQGMAPVKVEDSIILPLPGGNATRFSFPKYKERIYDNSAKFLVATDSQGENFRSTTELAEDISSIAKKNLANRRLRTIAKGVLRPAMKYFAEEQGLKAVEEQAGKDTSQWLRYLAILYNVYTEEADLRSWQTLPAEIRLGRLILPPGGYTVQFNNESLGKFTFKPGEKYFLFARTN